MNELTRQYINKLSQIVIDEYDIQIPIKDIDAIVREMGGKVEEAKMFDNLCDGTISKTGEESFSIKVSPLQKESRRQFTIAHELGHLFLHMGFRTDDELWKKQDEKTYMRFGASEQEYQANEFAASLLMPEKEYSGAIERNTDDKRMVDIEAVANYFNVSIAAATNRGKFLGYFE